VQADIELVNSLPLKFAASGVLVATNRMLALVTASQMASASVASFFCRLTYGFTYAGGIRRTVCPSALSSRDQ
jgi:hypothetical protein